MTGGIIMALQLIHWNPLNGIEWLSAGRWRMIHTNAVAYGFIANAFLGVLHWSVPRRIASSQSKIAGTDKAIADRRLPQLS